MVCHACFSGVRRFRVGCQNQHAAVLLAGGTYALTVSFKVKIRRDDLNVLNISYIQSPEI